VPTENQYRENLIRIIESQKTINKRYRNIRRINEIAGDGRFSLVFVAYDIETEKEILLKFFDPTVKDRYRIDCFDREAKILQDLRGQKNIVQLVEGKSTFNCSIVDQNTGLSLPYPLQYFSEELAGSGDTRTLIYSDTHDLLMTLFYFREMCKSVQRIYNRRICHRDIKPKNFLIFGRRDIRLSDFGTARYLTDDTKPLLPEYVAPPGDLRYVAPELLCGLCFDKELFYSADIFSLGCILFEAFTKTLLSRWTK